MTDPDVLDKAIKYVKQLEKENKIEHALNRLEAIKMNVDLITKSGAGKAVNRLRNHGIYGERAAEIVSRWKEVVQRERERERDRENRKRQRSPSHSSSSSSSASRSPTPSPEPGPSAKKEKHVNPIIVKATPTAFEQMLLTGDKAASKPRKPKLDDLKLSRTELDLNYRPLPVIIQKAAIVQTPVDEAEQFRPRNERFKMFAGSKKSSKLTSVPSLYSCCINVIAHNINAIEDTGSIPFDILKPVLERCTAQQLMYIENRNPYLEEDSDCLWEKLVAKHYPGQESDHSESWKEAFRRMEVEKEIKLRNLSKKLGTGGKETDRSHRQTAMILDAKAPRDVRARQIKHGTGHVNKNLPSAIEVHKARKEVYTSGGSKASLAVIPSAVINRTSQVGAKKDTKKAPVKKGALMMKTMKMLNMKRR